MVTEEGGDADGFSKRWRPKVGVTGYGYACGGEDSREFLIDSWSIPFLWVILYMPRMHETIIIEKSLANQKNVVPLHHKNPPSLFTMLKSAGRFVFMLYTKQYTSPKELVEILTERGLDCSDVPDAEGQLMAIGYFIDIIKPANTFKSDLLGLLSQYPDADTMAMGFPDRWKEEPLWQ